MHFLDFLLKAGAEHICSPLSLLFTTFMCTATLPKGWVTANVIPAFKHDDRSYAFDYTIGSSPFASKQKVKYLGAIISSNLKCNDHCKQIVHKVTQSLNRFQRTMYGCMDKAKAAVYLTLVRPCLEYCNVV